MTSDIAEMLGEVDDFPIKSGLEISEVDLVFGARAEVGVMLDQARAVAACRAKGGLAADLPITVTLTLPAVNGDTY